MRETKQTKELAKYSQLWLPYDDWERPLAVTNSLGQIVAWIVNRR